VAGWGKGEWGWGQGGGWGATFGVGGGRGVEGGITAREGVGDSAVHVLTMTSPDFAWSIAHWQREEAANQANQ
jgi:hypothetical protein